MATRHGIATACVYARPRYLDLQSLHFIGRAQLRAAPALTVRERLQALEDLAELAQRLARMPRTQGQSRERTKIHPDP